MPVIRNTSLTQERVRELFDYDSETGVLTRKTDVRSGRGSDRGSGKIQCQAGDVAGKIHRSSGYLDVRADGPIYRVHRLIWLWVYGYFPEHDIDHIDRDKTNNRLVNLREVTRSCNVRNRPRLTNNKSSVSGVHFCTTHKRWQAYLTVDKKRKKLGYYDEFLDAVKRRFLAEQELGWHHCSQDSSAAMCLAKYGLLNQEGNLIGEPPCPPRRRQSRQVTLKTQEQQLSP